MVELKIEPLEIVRMGNSFHLANHIFRRLKESGAPVEFPLQITSGRIIISSESLGTLVIRWEP